MAQGPIDYTSGFGQQSPFGGAVEAMQAGARFGVLEQQRAGLQQQQMMREQQMMAAQAEQERQGRLATAVDALIQNPNATRADYDRLAVLMPRDQREGLINAFNARTTEQQGNDLRFAGQIQAALRAGNPAMAQRLLVERAEAERNSGQPAQARQWGTWAQIAETSPDGLRVVVGEILATLPGGGAVLDAISKARTEERAAEEFVPKQAKLVADAALARINVDFAPRKLAADLGLTEAQTAQARAAVAAHAVAARASEATRAEATARANEISAGILPPERRAETEGKLRAEYRNGTATFREVRDAFGRVNASQDSAVGDLSLIFGYMKMLDPGSVVREGEFATAQNAAGVPERVANVYNRVISGQRLSPAQRSSFKAQAGELFRTAGEDEKKVRDGVTRIARNYGLNTDNIFIEPQSELPPANPASRSGAVPRAGGAAGRNVTVNY